MHVVLWLASIDMPDVAPDFVLNNINGAALLACTGAGIANPGDIISARSTTAKSSWSHTLTALSASLIVTSACSVSFNVTLVVLVAPHDPARADCGLLALALAHAVRVVVTAAADATVCRPNLSGEANSSTPPPLHPSPSPCGAVDTGGQYAGNAAL